MGSYEKFAVGPIASEQLARYRAMSQQSQHIVVSGATGWGKTRLIPELVRPRLDAGGHVMVLVMKPQPDETIVREFTGWVRWKKFKKRPSPTEKRILLWPDTKGMTMAETLEHQKKIFAEVFDGIFQTGHWTVVIDEGLYTVNPQFLNRAHDLAMLHSIGRSQGVTLITLTQRPAHLPLIVYSSAAHAFVGRTTETSDLKRLSELGGRASSREIATTMTNLHDFDFLWIPARAQNPPEILNLKR